MGSYQSQHCESSVVRRKNSQTLLKRNSSTLHSLHSLRDHKQHIWKRWRFYSQSHAEDKFRELQDKKDNALHSEFFLAVQDVHFSLQNEKGTQPSFWISARIQYPQRSLKKVLLDRARSGASFSECEIWQYLSGFMTMIEKGAHFSTPLPQTLSEIYLTADEAMKLKDPQILCQIRVSKENKNSGNQNELLLPLLKHIVSLCLTEEKTQVSFHDINLINIKYSTNLAALLFKVYQREASFEAIKQVIRSSKIDRDVKAESINKFKASFCHRKNSNVSNHSESALKEITENPNHQANGQFNNIITEKQNNYQRVQKIHPTRLIIANENEKNENCSAGTSPNTNKTSLKTSVDDEQLFPKAVKLIKKSSIVTEDEGSRVHHPKVSESNECGQSHNFTLRKCLLLNEDANESLLESIIESDEENMEIKTSRNSPVMDLDEEIEAITKDFYKLQQEFLQREQKESVLSFHNTYQRNSTIMEVTEENQDSEEAQSFRKSKLLEELLSVSREQEEQEDEEELVFTIEEYEGGSRYEGYTLNSLRHGFGKLFYEDGGSYEGNWRSGEIDGFGKLYYQSGNLAYEGEWRNGEFDGEGRIFNECPDQIEGCFNYRDFSELGMCWEWYEGCFRKDNKDGKGVLMLKNGEKLSGTWVANNVEGKCCYETLGGQTIVGIWENNILVQVMEA